MYKRQAQAHAGREANTSAGNVGERTSPPLEASRGVHSRDPGTDTGAAAGGHPHPAHAGARNPPKEGRGEGALAGEAGVKVVVAGGATTTFEERTTWMLSAVSDESYGSYGSFPRGICRMKLNEATSLSDKEQ